MFSSSRWLWILGAIVAVVAALASPVLARVSDASQQAVTALMATSLDVHSIPEWVQIALVGLALLGLGATARRRLAR